jgi:hypothetical protein
MEASPGQSLRILVSILQISLPISRMILAFDLPKEGCVVCPKLFMWWSSKEGYDERIYGNSNFELVETLSSDTTMYYYQKRREKLRNDYQKSLFL